MQIRPLLINAAVGALAAIAAGCAMTAQTPPSKANLDNLTKVENLPGKSACFWKSSFQGDWTVLNDSTLILHAPLPKDAYVIKLFEPESMVQRCTQLLMATSSPSAPTTEWI
jgi:hypothetical protein